MQRNIFQNFGKVKGREYTVEIIPSNNRVEGRLCTVPYSVFNFYHHLAGELKRKGLGVEIKGHWIGACFFFADDIVLVAEMSKELQEMLDLVGRFAKDWKMRFKAKKCGVTEVGEKKKKRLWTLGKDSVEEVVEDKYLAVWINRQANGFNHAKHLLGKADNLPALVREQSSGRGKKILWQDWSCGR